MEGEEWGEIGRGGRGVSGGRGGSERRGGRGGSRDRDGPCCVGGWYMVGPDH